MTSLKPWKYRRCARRQRGSNLVEFALVAPIFFFLTIMIVELGILFWVNLTMQYAVREGARYAITGQSNLDPAQANKKRYQAVIAKIRSSSMGLYDAVNPTIVVGGVNQAPDAYNETTFGAANSLLVLQLNCTWPVITPAWRLMRLLNPQSSTQISFDDGLYRFSVSATMRNEGFT